MTTKAQARSGICAACGQPVVDHFDEHNGRVSCHSLLAAVAMAADPILEPLPPDVQQPVGPKHRVPQAPQLLTRTQICDRIGCSRWTWRRWVTCGEAPAPVAGLPGIPKWRVSDIERFERGGRRFFGAHQRSAKQRVSRKLSLVHDDGSVRRVGAEG